MHVHQQGPKLGPKLPKQPARRTWSVGSMRRPLDDTPPVGPASSGESRPQLAPPRSTNSILGFEGALIAPSALRGPAVMALDAAALATGATVAVAGTA